MALYRNEASAMPHFPPELPVPRLLDAYDVNTHAGELVAQWMNEHPGRLRIYYLPFYASWLNQVELWLRTVRRRCLACASFSHVDELRCTLLAFIETYNRLEAHVYRWTYTGDVLVA